MGQECSTCKTCTDQEEIRAETSISAKRIVTGINKDKDKIHKTTQKSTNHTASTSQTNNHSPKNQKKTQNSK